ncbi:MAG: sel1 repeat family protein [Sulfurimonas sp.]|nr:sel1 repeat family protein [Sulfurimonas sp.]
MKKLILGLLVSVSLFGSDFDDAYSAYEKGDYKKAVKLFKKACDGGYAGGCYNLGFMYNDGLGVKQDYFKAVELYKKACDGGDASGCSNLGVMYKYGLGVKQNNFKALELSGKACDMKFELGCKNYASLKKELGQ